MPVVCILSIYIATGNSCTVGNENVLVGYFWEGGRWNFKKKVVMQVIDEKMKICYLHVINNTYPQDVS